MSLFRRSGGSSEVRQFAPEPVIPVARGADPYGRRDNLGTPDGALAVPAVWACVSLLANAVSMLPLETYRLMPDGVTQRVASPALLTQPAATMTQSEWLHMLMVSLLLRGNAYGLVTDRDSAGRSTQIDLLNPDKVRLDVRDGGPRYNVNPAVPDVWLTSEDVWHVRGMTLPGTWVGLSPIAYAMATLGVDVGARRFARDFFDGSAIPASVLSSDQPIDQPTAQAIKDRWKAAVSGRDVAVVGAGLKYASISVNPEESQFLQTMNADVGQIARYFSVPAGLIGGQEGGSLTYNNTEQRGLDFLTFGVSFWLKRIEDAVYPLLPRPQFVRFDTKALLRTDAETEAKIDVQLLAGKIVAPSEVRARRNLPPMTEAQKAEADMVPLTITPLGGAKALPGEHIPPGPVAPVPADDQQHSE